MLKVSMERGVSLDSIGKRFELIGLRKFPIENKIGGLYKDRLFRQFFNGVTPISEDTFSPIDIGYR